VLPQAASDLYTSEISFRVNVKVNAGVRVRVKGRVTAWFMVED